MRLDRLALRFSEKLPRSSGRRAERKRSTAGPSKRPTSAIPSVWPPLDSTLSVTATSWTWWSVSFAASSSTVGNQPTIRGEYTLWMKQLVCIYHSSCVCKRTFYDSQERTQEASVELSVCKIEQVRRERLDTGRTVRSVQKIQAERICEYNLELLSTIYRYLPQFILPDFFNLFYVKKCNNSVIHFADE